MRTNWCTTQFPETNPAVAELDVAGEQRTAGDDRIVGDPTIVRDVAVLH